MVVYMTSKTAICTNATLLPARKSTLNPRFLQPRVCQYGLVGGDLYVAGNEVVGSSAAPFYALDNSLEYRLVDQNTRQSPTGLFNYATGANGNLYASLGGQIIISTPPPDHGILHSTFGETDSVHIGQLLYNPDAKLIQAAATVSVSGLGIFKVFSTMIQTQENCSKKK